MSKEIFIPAAFAPGTVVYVVEYDAQGRAWRPGTAVWEAHGGTQSNYVGNRATIGSNGNYGPYDAQPMTRNWVAFITTQTGGSESLTLDEAAFDAEVRTSFDRLEALVPQVVTTGLTINSQTVITFALPQTVSGATSGPYDGYDAILYDESAGRRNCRRRILSSVIQSGVAVQITLEEAPDFTIDPTDTIAIVAASAQFERLSEEVQTFGAGAAASVDNTDIVEARVSKVGTRRDGVYVAFPPWDVVQGEPGPFWTDCTALTGGRNLSNVTSGLTSDPLLTLTSQGLSGRMAVTVLDSSSTPAGDYTIQFKAYVGSLWRLVEQPVRVRLPMVLS
ncbi:MAG: hypothetical protein AB7G28_22690 [Pirellulales bacterium]